MATTRINFVTNPSHENGGGAASTISMPANTISYPSDGGVVGTRYTRRTVTATDTGSIGGGLYWAFSTSGEGGKTYTASTYVRTDQAQYWVAQMEIGGGEYDDFFSQYFEAAAGEWTRIWVTGTAPEGSLWFEFYVEATGGSEVSHNWTIGETIDNDATLIEESDKLLNYFDGNLPDDALFSYAWESGANTSRSIATVIDSPLRTVPAPYGTVKATNSKANLTITYRSGWLG